MNAPFNCGWCGKRHRNLKDDKSVKVCFYQCLKNFIWNIRDEKNGINGLKPDYWDRGVKNEAEISFESDESENIKVMKLGLGNIYLEALLGIEKRQKELKACFEEIKVPKDKFKILLTVPRNALQEKSKIVWDLISRFNKEKIEQADSTKKEYNNMLVEMTTDITKKIAALTAPTISISAQSYGDGLNIFINESSIRDDFITPIWAYENNSKMLGNYFDTKTKDLFLLMSIKKYCYSYFLLMRFSITSIYAPQFFNKKIPIKEAMKIAEERWVAVK